MGKEYYIRLYNKSFKVSEKEYIEYYKLKRRIKYLREADRHLNIFSYNALDTDHRLGEEIIPDTAVNIEEQVCQKMMLEKLRLCLVQLSNDELYLINQLIYQEKTEQEIADKFRVSQVAIHKKKKRILKKLKNLLI